MNLNVGDLISVKLPVNEAEVRSYQKGIGYVKSKFSKPRDKYRTWIVVEWIDEPVETIGYSVPDIDELIKEWDVYPVRKK